MAGMKPWWGVCRAEKAREDKKGERMPDRESPGQLSEGQWIRWPSFHSCFSLCHFFPGLSEVGAPHWDTVLLTHSWVFTTDVYSHRLWSCRIASRPGRGFPDRIQAGLPSNMLLTFAPCCVCSKKTSETQLAQWWTGVSLPRRWKLPALTNHDTQPPIVI